MKSDHMPRKKGKPHVNPEKTGLLASSKKIISTGTVEEKSDKEPTKNLKGKKEMKSDHMPRKKGKPHVNQEKTGLLASSKKIISTGTVEEKADKEPTKNLKGKKEMKSDHMP